MNKLRIMASVTICIVLFLSVMYLANEESEPVSPVEIVEVEPSQYEKYVEFIDDVNMYGVTDGQIKALEKEYNIAKFPNDDIARAKLANAKVWKYNRLLRDVSAKDAKNYRTELLRLDGVIKSTGLEPMVQNHHDAYYKPTDLFYGFLWYDGVYVSQSFDEHVANNGLKGIDVATSGRSLAVHAPDLYNKEIEWEVSVPSVGCKKRSIGQCIYFTNDTHRVIYGHMASWNGKEKVKTGDNVGIVGGCGNDPNEGISTGCHLHIEYQYWDKYKNDWVNFEYTLAKSNKHENKDGTLSFDAQVYKDAEKATGTPWQVISAVHCAETYDSKRKTCTRHTGSPSSSAGATGCMQFLPSTFAKYGIDGDGDGVANITNCKDSIFSAGNYLQANYKVSSDGYYHSFFRYNQAQWYVDRVEYILREKIGYKEELRNLTK